MTTRSQNIARLYASGLGYRILTTSGYGRNRGSSFILKVKAAEIILYHLGITMRFPRALQIRDDLDISDCATASSVMENLRSDKKRKQGDDNGNLKKKQKRTAKKPTMMAEYQGVNLKNVMVETQIFEGMTFMVASDPRSKTGEQDKKELLKLIHENGGSYVQVAKSKPDIIVVYGGTYIPYDIKMIMNKGICDIIRPQWIMDCIAEGEKVPLTKKYFFHATPARKAEPEYNTGDESDKEVPVDEEAPEVAALSTKDVIEEDEDDWTQVEANDSQADAMVEVAGSQLRDSHISQTESIGVRMGEDDDAMEYDQNFIFKHLCFYLDSPQNAKRHGMTVKSKIVDVLNKRFDDLAKLITDNGGRVVDLDEPKLTHIVIDKRDTGRRLELIERTSKPKRRNLVVSEFLEACLDEGTLLDENDFAP
ncbi:DNA ligase 4 [Grifola frondosa]|uniref:DNA ligase 4 n=1 Tax=Grifola frondosa TaxID=5627 RepID=A0A1C7MAC1_GRIFR|nr:DNA ligase 4 [Grifola frondosa]